MARDRVALFAAYVLLIGITAWSARSTADTLAEIEAHVCRAALADAVFSLALAREGALTDDRRVDALFAALDVLVADCEAYDVEPAGRPRITVP